MSECYMNYYWGCSLVAVHHVCIYRLWLDCMLWSSSYITVIPKETTSLLSHSSSIVSLFSVETLDYKIKIKKKNKDLYTFKNLKLTFGIEDA